MTWNIAEIFYTSDMNVHHKAFKNSWMCDHNNVCVLYNLTKKNQWTVFPFTVQMQQKQFIF